MSIFKKLINRLSKEDAKKVKPAPTIEVTESNSTKLVKPKNVKKNLPKEQYITAIKPTPIVMTSIERQKLSKKIDNNDIMILTQDKIDELINIDKLSNNEELIEISKSVSNLRYKLEHPVITDMSISIYTYLTTTAIDNPNSILKDIKRTKGNGLRFVIEKTELVKLIMGNGVSSEGFAVDGLGKVRKNIMNVLTPLLSGKAGVPRQLIHLENYEMPNGDVKDLLLKVSPLHFYSSIVDLASGREFVDMELNGLLFPIKKINKIQYRANGTFLHVPNNLSVILSVGADLYIDSVEYQKTNKKTKYEVSRRFIDFIQLVYSRYDIPEVKSEIKGNKLIIYVWGDTLKSLMPTAFRTKGSIRRQEIIDTANISSEYFHLGIDFLGRRKQIENSDYLVVPDRKNFCIFEKPSEICTFICKINTKNK